MCDSSTAQETLITGAAPNSITLAVLSDLHAYDHVGSDELTEPSHLCIRHPADLPGKHPIRGLLDLIDANKLTADLLLCPGDLGDKARPAGILYAWQAINNIAAKLKCPKVIATVGNHDVDSRFKYSDHDPKGYLQSLSPPFPLSEEHLNDRSWARNFVVFEQAVFRIIVLNSSAFHGTNHAEIGHGRISERTLAAITGILDTTTQKSLNILLCHHHPHKHSEVSLGEFDEMLGGQLLLSLLGSGKYGEWIIIHGHKHHPKICYAAGGVTAPLVFSAGSLCAKLYPELGTVARNQFYLIRFPYGLYETMGFVGTFQSWDWITGIGWATAQQSGSGLPGTGGFGYRGNLHQFASKVATQVSRRPQPWNTLVLKNAQLEYMLPSDLATLISILRSVHQIEVLTDAAGLPKQIGRVI